MPQPTKARAAKPAVELDLGPGAAMRALAEEQRRQKRKRRRKRLAIAAVAFVVLAYLGVTTFVFNPLEGSVIAFQNLVPRTSDFFARKVDLAGDLPLPATPVTPFHESASLWTALEAGKLFLTAADAKALASAQREFVDTFDSIRFLDPVRDLAGREIALAGAFAPTGGLGASRFGLYLRVSWRVRAAVGLLKYAAMRSWLLPPDLKVERLPSGVLRVVGAAGARDLYVSRDRDLLLVASDERWISESAQLDLDRGEGSFGQSAIYADEIQTRVNARRDESGDPPSNLQLYVVVPSLRRTIADNTPWPDPKSASLVERFFASCFSTALPQEAAALIRFDAEPKRAVAVEAFMDLNAGVLDDFGKRLYAERPITQADLKRIAQMAPQSSFLFGAATLSGGALARQVEALLETEDRRAVDTAFQHTGKYPSLRAAIEDFAVATGDRVVFFGRENVFPKDPKDPKSDEGPQPAIAFAFPQRSPEKVKHLQEFFLANKQHFGVTETMRLGTSYPVLEYYSPGVPGTGEIAVVVANNWVFLGNQAKYLRAIADAWLTPARIADKPYSEDPAFVALTEEHDQPANAFLYVSGPKLAKALRPYVEHWVRVDTLGDPNAERAEREALEQRVLSEKYPQHVGQNVPPAVRAEVVKIADERMEQKRQARRTSAGPELRAGYHDALRLVESIPAALLTLRFDPKHASVYARVEVE